MDIDSDSEAADECELARRGEEFPLRGEEEKFRKANGSSSTSSSGSTSLLSKISSEGGTSMGDWMWWTLTGSGVRLLAGSGVRGTWTLTGSGVRVRVRCREDDASGVFALVFRGGVVGSETAADEEELDTTAAEEELGPATADVPLPLAPVLEVAC